MWSHVSGGQSGVHASEDLRSCSGEVEERILLILVWGGLPVLLFGKKLEIGVLLGILQLLVIYPHGLLTLKVLVYQFFDSTGGCCPGGLQRNP